MAFVADAADGQVLTCSGCKQTKQAHSFTKDVTRPTGYRARCKPCQRITVNANNKKKRELDPSWVRRNHMKYVYGLSLEEWGVLFEKQGEKCRVCKSPSPRTKRAVWHTDHNHLTGKVRGILCSHCNQMLGMAHEDTAIMLAGAEYLKKRDG